MIKKIIFYSIIPIQIFFLFFVIVRKFSSTTVESGVSITLTISDTIFDLSFSKIETLEVIVYIPFYTEGEWETFLNCEFSGSLMSITTHLF